MLELRYESAGVSASVAAAAPRMVLGLRVRTLPAGVRVHGMTLHAQVHIECGARDYGPSERERLRELFGERAQWQATLRSVLWARVTAHASAFTGECVVELELPCSAELELVASKYFFAAQTGEVPLRLMFSGSVLYGEERVQVAPVDQSRELVLPLPLRVVQEAIELHHADRRLLGLRRDVFEQLHRYRRERSLPSWEHTIERLLAEATRREGGS